MVESKREGQYFPVEETDEGTYIFNAKDLCMIDHLQELLDAGVDSLKIEGRNKSAYYVAIITNAYRAALDAAMAGQPAPEWALREVVQVSHREYCTGFSMAEKTLPSDTPTAAMSGIVTWWQWSTAGNRADCTSPRETAFLRGFSGNRGCRTAAGDGGCTGAGKRGRRIYRNRKSCHDAVLHCL